MQRTTLAALGLLVVLGLVLAAVLRGTSKRELGYAAPSASLAASARAPTPSPSASGEPVAEALVPDSGAPGFDLLPDGRVPALPADAPKNVGFGVILFTYEGAQAAPAGARTKSAAKDKAAGVVAEAARDFKAAIAKGDRGSIADAGHVPRGVLEPAVEYVLFTLAKGAVHPEPVDTPRGYWVVRRND